MSEYLVKKICKKIDDLSEKDHVLIKESLLGILDKRRSVYCDENISKLNLDLENYIINVIDIINNIKNLAVKLEKNKIN